uniref:Ribokinase isoform X3 n=1 Tax=Nicotiana tabacum TaxID=4097 RepID=A0A1S4CI42_TOBAC|nr:PREDICTED: ribokinase-like isoform X3 [Nicotiana tabacum]
MATLGQLLPSCGGTVLNSSTLLPSPFPSPTTARNFRVKMSIPATQASIVLPENRIILGCGSVGVDFLAAVASYPNPDDKIRSTSFQVQGGGNAGNALTCAARLGLTPRIISKVSNDSQGKGILEELEADGVDSSFIVVSDGGNSPFTYIIVDNQTKTRTCIHTPGYPPMIPTDLSQSNLLSSLDGAKLVYFDGRLHETAAVVAEEANTRGIPILIDAERKREGLDHLLSFASYVVCSTKFPQEWTDASSIPSALLSMLLRLPKVKFVIVTLGEDGCLMLQRTEMDNQDLEERDVDDLFEKLNQKKDTNATSPACISSVFTCSSFSVKQAVMEESCKKCGKATCKRDRDNQRIYPEILWQRLKCPLYVYNSMLRAARVSLIV